MDYYKVEIISKELIKPSSSTPDHLKTLKLSFIDQISPSFYIPLIFFYEADPLKVTSRAQICRHLKQSLSNTLTLVYPLAGKIDPHNPAIHCDDTGVEFVEARARTRLGDVIHHDPKPEELRKYLPVDDLLGGMHNSSGGEGTILTVQVNFFDCGGVAVGACVSHLVADVSSVMDFMNAWAAACRGNEVPKPDQYFGVVARYFAARDLSGSKLSPSLLMGNDKLVTRRFMFDREKLAALKEDARSDSVNDPTRVEVVPAFICKNLMEALSSRQVAHMVNIRSRASPSLGLESAFGNRCFLTSAPINSKSSLSCVVSELRKAIRKIDNEYVRQADAEQKHKLKGKIATN